MHYTVQFSFYSPDRSIDNLSYLEAVLPGMFYLCATSFVFSIFKYAYSPDWVLDSGWLTSSTTPVVLRNMYSSLA